MHNWTNRLISQHNRHYRNNGFGLVLGSPSPTDQFKNLNTVSGFSWPNEFTDLYSVHNGSGIVVQGNKIEWSFVPLELLMELREEAVSWFRDTHPDLSQKFFPFFNWHSGDYLGYLKSDAEPHSRLFEFEHEKYDFDEIQPWQDFLRPVFDTIEEFIDS